MCEGVVLRECMYEDVVLGVWVEELKLQGRGMSVRSDFEGKGVNLRVWVCKEGCKFEV